MNYFHSCKKNKLTLTNWGQVWWSSVTYLFFTIILMLNCSIEGRVDQLLRNHIEDKVERQLFSLERDSSTTCLLKTRLLVDHTVQTAQSIAKILFTKDKAAVLAILLTEIWTNYWKNSINKDKVVCHLIECTLFTLYKPSKAFMIKRNDGTLLRTSMNLFTIERLLAIMLTSLYNNF